MPVRKQCKQILLATNGIRWHNQNQNKQWEKIIAINWKLMLHYLQTGDLPTTLCTNPRNSKIKNFKIKALADKLPNHLKLHYRNPKKYNHICPRYGIESESTTHILICRYNSCSLEQIISKVLRRLANTKEIILKNQDNFIYRFIHIHITKGLPLGFITQETLIL